ncbi:MAG: hypothetical protein KDD15_31795, partial [Lewinella sp.]|nr:hypothetical protein [Lewinella sp.]
YCEMLQEDQFHASGDAMKQGAAEEGDAKKVYKKNFDQLLEIARRQGFPRVSREDSDSPQDSCTYWAIAATFIHTAKSNPEFFFEKSNVNLMKTEMSKENLNKEFLILACNISFQTVTFCNELQPSVENAIKAWNLSPKIYDKARFTQCD